MRNRRRSRKAATPARKLAAVVGVHRSGRKLLRGRDAGGRVVIHLIVDSGARQRRAQGQRAAAPSSRAARARAVRDTTGGATRCRSNVTSRPAGAASFASRRTACAWRLVGRPIEACRNRWLRRCSGPRQPLAPRIGWRWLVMVAIFGSDLRLHERVCAVLSTVTSPTCVRPDDAVGSGPRLASLARNMPRYSALVVRAFSGALRRTRASHSCDDSLQWGAASRDHAPVREIVDLRKWPAPRCFIDERWSQLKVDAWRAEAVASASIFRRIINCHH